MSTANKMSKANKRQIGGDHYKLEEGEEHWDRIYRMWGPGYFVGCITKYVERAHNHEDGVIPNLEKAQHFIEKLIELEKQAKVKK
jgi:hypothetical protein